MSTDYLESDAASARHGPKSYRLEMPRSHFGDWLAQND